MKLKDRSGWVKFVHDLLYPAILGSMIYDLFPIGELNLNYTIDYNELFKVLFKIVVVSCYCIDYIHFHQNLLRHDFKGKYNNLKKQHILYDALIALIFRVAFWGIQIEAYWLTLLVFVFLAFTFTNYIPGNNIEAKFYKYVLVLLFGFLALIPLLSVKVVSILIVTFFAGVYFCYAFFLYDKWNLSRVT